MATGLGTGPLRALRGGGGPRLGLNTYSLRALNSNEALPAIIEVMRQTGLQDCQLWFPHLEPVPLPATAARRGSTPDPAAQAQREAHLAAERTRWRMTVPMSYFTRIRARFGAAGLRIRSYSVLLGTTPEELDRQFEMTEALGAEALIARVPEAATSMVAEAATRHRLLVGVQFSDPETLQRQLQACPLFRADPDTGDLTKLRIDPLPFLGEHLAQCLSVDLKDALRGGGSVAFGQGDARLREVLQLLSSRSPERTAYIDCDYPGTGRSVQEVQRCVAYVRQCLA